MANASIASMTPAPASADEAESWVRGELIRSLMRSARGSSADRARFSVLRQTAGQAGSSWTFPRWRSRTASWPAPRHDIRQPVHALGCTPTGWVPQRAGAGARTGAQDRRLAATKAVNVRATLFDSLFDLARSTRARSACTSSACDVAKLLHDLELQYRPLAEAKGLRLPRARVPGTFLSDPILLQRMIGNLISNAIKYTQRGRRAGGRAQDARRPARRGLGHRHGHRAGAPARDLPEFYKVPTTPAPTDGFGLGLYIVARLSHILGHPLSCARGPAAARVPRGAARPTEAWRRRG
jgi:K+-sensing histidine kinase KdpD